MEDQNGFIYFIMSFLFNIRSLRDGTIRLVLYIAAQVLIVTSRTEIDEANPIVSFAMAFTFTTVLEGINYLIFKDKANLFLRIKTAKMQEE